MRPISEQQLREAFVNTSQRERAAIPLPPDFASLDWSDLDMIGWRDAKLATVGYVLVELDDQPVAIMVREAHGKARARPQCAWCEDVTLPNDVQLFIAKRAGRAGRDGNTLGTLVCSAFECNRNVRRLPPVAYIGYDVESARQQRIIALGEHARAFVLHVRDGR